MKEQTLQDFLFESILSRFPRRSAAVDAISDMFGLEKMRYIADCVATPYLPQMKLANWLRHLIFL